MLLTVAATTTTATTTDPWRFELDVGKGVVIEKPDLVRLATRLRGQFLYTFLDDGDAVQSFQIRRARVAFTGYVFSRDITYKMELALSPRDIGLEDAVTRSPLLDLYFRFSHLRDLALQVGQYKVPYNRERVISSGNLNLVDRSIANAEFNLDRDVGLDLRSRDLFELGLLRYYAGIYTGEGRDAFEEGDFGMMYLARLEVLPFGLFKDYTEGDLARRESPKLSVGVAYAYVDEAKRDRGTIGSIPEDEGTTDTHNVEADLLFFYRGFSLLFEFFYRRGERNPPEGAAVVDLPRDGLGFSVQPGYLLPWLDLELVTRFARVAPRGESSLVRQSELVAGINYYFVRHSLKLQADYSRLWERDDIGEGMDRVRVQLQAAF